MRLILIFKTRENIMIRKKMNPQASPVIASASAGKLQAAGEEYGVERLP
jgi:hypothetical protein